ncbi:hypothetical protein D9M72_595780 [compost metagenome]
MRNGREIADREFRCLAAGKPAVRQSERKIVEERRRTDCGDKTTGPAERRAKRRANVDIVFNQTVEAIGCADGEIERRLGRKLTLLENADMGIVFKGEFQATLRVVARLDHAEARTVFGSKRR